MNFISEELLLQALVSLFSTTDRPGCSNQIFAGFTEGKSPRAISMQFGSSAYLLSSQKMSDAARSQLMDSAY